MDKCREEFKQWYEKTTGLSTLPYKEMFLLEDAENKYAIWQARQSEIDALKAQVEELNEKLMLAEIRAERADIDHARQLAYWKIIVKHNLCEEVDKLIQQQKGEE